MKALITGSLLWIAAILGASAFEIPKNLGDITDLDSVAAKAAKKRAPIAFIITQKSLTPT